MESPTAGLVFDNSFMTELIGASSLIVPDSMASASSMEVKTLEMEPIS